MFFQSSPSTSEKAKHTTFTGRPKRFEYEQCEKALAAFFAENGGLPPRSTSAQRKASARRAQPADAPAGHRLAQAFRAYLRTGVAGPGPLSVGEEGVEVRARPP